MRLIASNLALKGALALAAAGELPLHGLASALQANPTSAHRALEVLLADGVAERRGARPVFALAKGPVANQVVELALVALPLEEAVTVICRSNAAVEFVAERHDQLTVVFSSRQPTALLSCGAKIINRLAARHGQPVRKMDHRDVRDELLARPQLREEIRGMRILYGDLDRTFPDRRLHGATTGRPLGRAHPSVRRPSRRALNRIAKQHDILSMSLFGSAVRSDFRPDSDIDVLIRFRPGARPSYFSLAELGDDLEEVLDRDVDVVPEHSLGPEMSKRVAAEAVSLL